MIIKACDQHMTFVCQVVDLAPQTSSEAARPTMGNRSNHPAPADLGVKVSIGRTTSGLEAFPAADQVTKEQYTAVQPWSKAEDRLTGTQAEYSDLRQLVDKKNAEIESLKRQLYDKEQLISEVEVTVEGFKKKLIQLHLLLQGKLALTWMDKIAVSTESIMQRGSAAAVGGVAFFNPDETNIVYAYKGFSQKWSKLQPHCQHYSFTLIAINGLLTAVGGSREKYTPGRTLLSFSEGKWKEVFPAMSMQRSSPAAVCVGQSVVVAGGCKQDLLAIEIMNSKTLQWSTASFSLPVHNEATLSLAALLTCGDDLYSIFGESDDRTHIYACSSFAVLQSYINIEDNEESVGSQEIDDCIWRRISDVPVSQSTTVAMCGRLISIGGSDNDREVDTVCCYDARTDSWSELGSLISPKSLPLATTLPGNRLVVVHDNYDGTFVGTATIVES